MNYRNVKIFEVSDWDKLVTSTHRRPYSFQQQDGCRERGLFAFTVPGSAEDYKKSSIPETLNNSEMGVKYSAWISRDPNDPISGETGEHSLRLWWHRNFYPHPQFVANELFSLGVLAPGEYGINVDW